ncbi:hypothetical protein [Spiroplasma endosymbiont of Agriotes lineatus]|uniref:hypothetical protein n=1 Tax=Spiroplasma endosymbiont of Agriotes lineatus TaxID=3077930 RepID=UPI0030D40B2E
MMKQFQYSTSTQRKKTMSIKKVNNLENKLGISLGIDVAATLNENRNNNLRFKRKTNSTSCSITTGARGLPWPP